VIDIVDVPERGAFEIRVDGKPAGHADYKRDGNRRIFTHTEIDPAFGGQGLGGKLAAFALDATRAAGERIVPRCPFIRGYLGKHPEYADVVDPP
jgi:uncharacterized protein